MYIIIPCTFIKLSLLQVLLNYYFYDVIYILYIFFPEETNFDAYNNRSLILDQYLSES